jgi:Alginate export
MMRRLLPLLLLTALVLPNLVIASLPFIEKDGEPIATLNLEMRPRWELEGRDFNDDTGLSDYSTMRTMIGINIMPIDNFSVHLNLQESRYLGTQPTDREATAQLEVREAFFRVDDLFGKNIALQAGRFTWQTGRGRVFGYNDWSFHGPNAYDGMLIEWPCGMWPDKGRWSLLAARVLDYDFSDVLLETEDPFIVDWPWNDPAYEQDLRDRTLFALSGSFFDGTLQPFVSADIDGRDKRSSIFLDYIPRRLYHAGVYFGDTWNQVSFNVDATYQWGENNDFQVKIDSTGREIGGIYPTLKSWMLAADIGYEFDTRTHPALTFGFDGNYGSWEPDESLVAGYANENFPYFQTPFASHHEFHGQMDIHWRSIPRLVDLFASLDMNPTDDLNLELAYHRFIAQEERRHEDVTVDIGHEIDLEMNWQVNEYLEIGCGYSTFIFVGENSYGLIARRENFNPIGTIFSTPTGSSDYAWLQATVRF